MRKDLLNFVKNEYFYRYLTVLALSLSLLFFLIESLSTILTPFLGGLLVAYVLDRPMSYLERFKISRAFSAAALILLFFIFFITVIMLFLPFLGAQFLGLAEGFPQKIEAFFQRITSYIQKFEYTYGAIDYANLGSHFLQTFGDVAKFSTQMLFNMIKNAFAVANVVSCLILTPIISFYMAKDWNIFLTKTRALLPSQHCQKVVLLFTKIDQTLASYARGQIVVCFLLTLTYLICFFVIDFPYPFSIALMSGLSSFVPYLGIFLGFSVSLFIIIANGYSLSMFLSVLTVFFLVSVIEGKILIPKFIGKRIGLHPVWILFGILSFAQWFGFFGIIFSLPLSIILSVILKELYGVAYQNRKKKTI